MAYCNQTDILNFLSYDELAQLTTETGTVPDATIVTDAIAMADAEIDAYCGKQYSVPFSPVPARVRALSVDIAIYHLFARRSIAPDIRRQKYEDAITFLRDVALGRAVLGETGSPPDSAGGSGALIASNDRVFTRSSMYGL